MIRGALALVSALALGAAVAGPAVSPAEVAQRLENARTAPFLLDVRTAEEFAHGHVPGAVNVPVQQLEQELAKVPKDRDVIVYCHTGARATRAQRLLKERGYQRVSEMAGSLQAWEAAGLPLEK